MDYFKVQRDENGAYVEISSTTFSTFACELHEHDFKEEVTTPATCTTDGLKTFTCVCGKDTYNEVITALGHTEGAEATCTTAQICTVCEEVLTAAKGHNFAPVVEAKAATCQATGNLAHKTCTVCNLFFAADADINATNGAVDNTEFVIAVDPENHVTDEVKYVLNETDAAKHDKFHACCDALIRTEDHTDTDKNYECDICRFATADAVAKIGDEENGYSYYGSVQSALVAAMNGTSKKVVMIKDSDETGKLMVLFGDITLDLNGFTLTATGLTAFKGNYVIDSTKNNTGALRVPKGNLSLPATECVYDEKATVDLPFWTGKYYIFLTPQFEGAQIFDSNLTTENSFTYYFRPDFGYEGENQIREKYLMTGLAKHGIKVIMQLSWMRGGDTIKYGLELDDDYLAQVYKKGSCQVRVSGVGSLGKVTINIIVESDEGFRMIGESHTYCAGVTE